MCLPPRNACSVSSQRTPHMLVFRLVESTA
jgi:hypothetical protein